MTTLPRHREGAEYDFAIVGAGVSGLCLALEVLDRFPSKTLILADPELSDLERRTLAFWQRSAPRRECAMTRALEAMIERSWTKIEIALPERRVHRALEAYRYHVITGHRFSAVMLDALLRTGRAYYEPLDVQAIEDVDHRVVARGARDSLVADWAFDSRLDSRHPPLASALHPRLVQHFAGWEICTDAPCFDPEIVTLFDFRIPREHDQRFVYILPFDPHHALVELVSLAPCPSAKLLNAYLREQLKVDAFEVVRRESGANLLTSAPFMRRGGKRILRIGNAGGRIKPSSGYAFTRIVRDSQAIADSLERTGHPFDLAPDSEAFRLLDRLFLRVSERAPEEMSRVFEAMLVGGPADRVFDLLDERASLSQILALGATLPIRPFALELGNSLARLAQYAWRRATSPVEYEA